MLIFRTVRGKFKKKYFYFMLVFSVAVFIYIKYNKKGYKINVTLSFALIFKLI